VASKEAALSELRALLDKSSVTQDLVVQARGQQVILGRMDDPNDPYATGELDERIRLTPLGGGRYGLSVRRHTGRWEKTPFSGTLPDLVDTITATMQHLVAAW
jgi:hypothetical protein